MQVQLRMKGRTLVVRLLGELDHHSAKTVKDTLEEAIAGRAAQNLVLDLTGLSFMDSSGIGVIIGRYKLIQALGGRMGLVCRDASVRRLITMSGLMRLMNVYETADQAVCGVQGGN